jgi:chromosome segregation ATPase
MRPPQGGDVAQLREEVTRARQVQQDLQQQGQAARTESQQWQARHAEVRLLLTQTQEHVQNLEAQLAQSKQEIAHLHAVHEQAAQHLQTLQTQMAQREEELRRLEAAQDTSQDTEFTRLRQAIVQTREALLAMQQQAQEARTDSQQWQARHADVMRNLTALQEQRTTMGQELGRLQALYEQAAQRLAETTQQQEYVRAQAREAQLESQQCVSAMPPLKTCWPSYRTDSNKPQCRQRRQHNVSKRFKNRWYSCTMHWRNLRSDGLRYAVFAASSCRLCARVMAWVLL